MRFREKRRKTKKGERMRFREKRRKPKKGEIIRFREKRKAFRSSLPHRQAQGQSRSKGPQTPSELQ